LCRSHVGFAFLPIVFRWITLRDRHWGWAFTLQDASRAHRAWVRRTHMVQTGHEASPCASPCAKGSRGCVHGLLSGSTIGYDRHQALRVNTPRRRQATVTGDQPRYPATPCYPCKVYLNPIIIGSKAILYEYISISLQLGVQKADQKSVATVCKESTNRSQITRSNHCTTEGVRGGNFGI
jgi:hypothetical protein